MSTMDHPTALAVRAPNSEEIKHFLVTRTGTEMTQLVQSISEPVAQATFATSLAFTSSVVSEDTKSPEKAKKALNAFVGFRCKLPSTGSRKAQLIEA